MVIDLHAKLCHWKAEISMQVLACPWGQASNACHRALALPPAWGDEGAPLQADDVAVELAAHEVKVGEDERLCRVEAARDDVLDVLLAQPVSLLQLQAPVRNEERF